MDAWTVRSSRYVVDDRWLRVRAEECTTSSGVDVSPYYLIDFPDFVHVLALDDDRNIILVRQYRHGLGGASLELPGGILDEDDRDVVAAARRELREETGYAGQDYEAVASLSVDPARYTNRLHLVVARGVKPGFAEPDPTETIEVVVIPQSEIVELALSGQIINSQHVGLLMIGLHHLRML